jgi:predicted NBD/HSP70 family sugar kinase
MPLLAQIPETVPHVLVVSDRTGADISAVGRGGQQLEREVTGRTYPIHRVSAGGWAEKHVQQRVENTWEENARLVARTVTELVAEYRAELVLVSGEERSRGELIRALGDTQELDVVEVAGGSRAPGTDEDHFRTELDKLLADRMAVRIALYAAAFREQVGRAQAGKDGRAVDGLADALAALRAAQVDTLLINDDPSADGTLLIGPEPTALAQTRTELHALNVTDIREDRADAALARTAAGTDAELILVPREELPLRDGVGCLLRY